MAISKRTRFEVLRRDNYTCRYCRSAENALTVDHVTPVALGGSDAPDNLVAACKDCNAGKSSSAPDSSLVADIAQDAVRWAKAIEEVAAIRSADKRKRDAYVRRFVKKWDTWKWGPVEKRMTIPKDSDWKPSIWQFYELGLPIGEVEDAVDIACSNGRVYTDDTWRYFCGVCWRKVKDMQEAARAVIEVDADGA